jgi:hypothetical protein
MCSVSSRLMASPSAAVAKAARTSSRGTKRDEAATAQRDQSADRRAVAAYSEGLAALDGAHDRA